MQTGGALLPIDPLHPPLLMARDPLKKTRQHMEIIEGGGDKGKEKTKMIQMSKGSSVFIISKLYLGALLHSKFISKNLKHI